LRPADQVFGLDQRNIGANMHRGRVAEINPNIQKIRGFESHKSPGHSWQIMSVMGT
jgi:hypothetical protein